MIIAIFFLFLVGSSLGVASWNNPVRELQVGNDEMGSSTTTSFSLLLNFLGRPGDVDDTGFQLIATNFAAAYENAEQIARIVGTTTFLRQLEDVQVEALALDTTLESLIPYSLLVRVNASCDTCEEGLSLFSNITAPRFFFPYDPWYGPSSDEVVFKFNQMRPETIDELLSAQQLSPIECSNDVTEFETDVLIDFVGDVGQATGEEILALSNAFQATYNVLNGVTNEGLCDRSFREVVGVSIDINQAQNRRSLQTGGVLGTFPGFNGTVFRPFTLFARIQGRCRNCPINTQIFDNDAGRRLDQQDTNKKKLLGWPTRQLQSSDDCFCSMSAQEFRAPSRAEFTEAFNTTVQVLAASNAVRFIASVEDEVIEVDPITCSSDVVIQETTVAVNVTGAGDNITADSSLAIEEEFANTYNALAQTTCDPFFRTLVNVTLVTVVVEEEQRRKLRNRQLMAPRGNVTMPLTLFLRVSHRCRKCPFGTIIFGADAGRRRLELKQQSTSVSLVDRFVRNLQEGQNDTCYCNTDFTIADAPPPSDFVVAYENNLVQRNVEGINSVEAIEEDVQIPASQLAGNPTFAPATAPPTSSPIVLPATSAPTTMAPIVPLATIPPTTTAPIVPLATIPPTTTAPVDVTALPSQGTTTVTTVPPPTECICPDLSAAAGPPQNDNCVQFQSIQIGGSPVIGSTVGATDETRREDVHYAFVGNGRRVRISTCFPETTTAHNFLLRNGGCSSSGFGESFSDPTCLGNVNAAAFEFDSVNGRTYPIHVYTRNAGAQGQFAIQVTDFVNPPNDYCSMAQMLTIGEAQLIGTTMNATEETRREDVHYAVVGNGRTLRVSTCFDGTTTAHNFLLRNGGCTSSGFGESFSDPTCLGNVNAAAFEFDSVNERTYPIHVYPRNPGVLGQFAIRVSEVASRKLHPFVIQSDQTTAIDDSCGPALRPLSGNAEVVAVSPSAEALFPKKEQPHLRALGVGILGGEHGEVGSPLMNGMSGRCLAGTIPLTPCVCSTRPNTGRPYNDDCIQYQSLQIGFAPLTGTTFNASDGTRGGDVNYAFLGNGRRVRISTCFAETTTAHNFLLRDGGCSSSGFGETSNDPNCPSNDNSATFEFDSVAGRFYPIHVYPRDVGVQGQFAIQVIDFVSPPNDYCSQYQLLEIGGSPVSGTTINATAETRGEDVHYAFTGNGRRVRISTCFDSTTTAHNFLLRNGGCSSSGFGETSNDPDCPGNANSATFEFDSIAGRFYPIHVYPRNPGVQGQFAIQVTDFVSPPNDYCSQYQSLEVGGSPVAGTTIDATAETRGEDVHYAFVGNGRRVRISTCFDGTTTAHNFLLRNGGCSSSGFGETSNDPDCPGNANSATFEFDSIAGRFYPIHVYPRNPGAQGQFVIQVTDFVNPANDYCSQYQSLEIGGSPVAGTTIDATAETRGEDVHYGVVGNGRTLRVSTCFDGTTTAHNFLLRNGGCSSSGFGETSNDPDCPGNANSATFEFDSIAGRFYPIHVYPRNPGAQGQFVIQVTDIG